MAEDRRRQILAKLDAARRETADREQAARIHRTAVQQVALVQREWDARLGPGASAGQGGLGPVVRQLERSSPAAGGRSAREALGAAQSSLLAAEQAQEAFRVSLIERAAARAEAEDAVERAKWRAGLEQAWVEAATDRAKALMAATAREQEIGR